jgi:hypothetical protein
MELSVLSELEQTRISAIRNDAAESVLEATAKHLAALATLLIRAKASLGFPDAAPTAADFHRALGEAEDIVADLAGHWPLPPSEAVYAADSHDALGGNAEYTIDAVTADCRNAVENVAKCLRAG